MTSQMQNINPTTNKMPNTIMRTKGKIVISMLELAAAADDGIVCKKFIQLS